MQVARNPAKRQAAKTAMTDDTVKSSRPLEAHAGEACFCSLI